MLDWTYALLFGPLRWFKPGPLYDILAVPKDRIEGCYFAAGSNTLLEVVTVYCNSAIVASVFTALYYAKFTTKRAAKRYYLIFLAGFVLLLIIFGAIVFISEVNTKMLGWCSIDSLGLVAKHIWFYLNLILQATMIVGIMVVLYRSTLRAGRSNNLNKGTFLRFIGILTSQMVGFLPLYLAELLAFSRQPIPDYLIYWYAIGFPFGQLIATIVISVQCIEVYIRKGCNSPRSKNDGVSASGSQSGSSHSISFTSIPTVATDPDHDNPDNNGVNDGSDGRAGVDQDESTEYEARKFAKFQGPKICRWWMSHPLPYHIGLTLVIPVMLFAGLVAVVSMNVQNVRIKSASSALDVEFVGLVNNYIHNSQLERGLTAMYYSAPNNDMLANLESQRAQTDTVRLKLLEFIKTYSNPSVMNTIYAFVPLSKVHDLPKHRAVISRAGCPNAINQSCLTLVEAIDYYTDINQGLLGVLVNTAKDGTDDDIMEPLVTSYFALVMMKELAGNERAVGAGAFSAGYFIPTQYVKFLRLTQAQDEVERSFLSWADDYVVQKHATFMVSDVVVTSRWMREKALSNDPAEIATVKDTDWFANMTAKIDLMRVMELNLGDRMAAQASRRAVSSGSVVVNLVFTIVCLIWINVLLGFSLHERIGLIRTKSEVPSNGVVACLVKYLCMKPSNRVSLFLQVMLISVASCAVSLIILVIILRNNVEIAQTNHFVVDQMGIVRLINNFMHQSQRERGRTGVFIGSGRSTIAFERLKTQQLATNNEKELLAAEFYKVAEVLGKDNGDYKASLHAISTIDEIREAIRTNLSIDDALEWYTIMNRRLVKVMAELCVRGRSTANYLDMYAFEHFSRMKELEGEQRLWGSVGILEGNFTPSLYRQFIRRDESQKWRMDFFQKFASSAAKQELQNLIQDEVKHNDMRDKLMIKNYDLSPFNAFEWFNRESVKIASMRNVEESLRNNLANAVLEKVSSSSDTLFTLVTISCLLIILQVYFVYKEVRAIIRRQKKPNAPGGKMHPLAIASIDDDFELCKELANVYDILAVINGGLPSLDLAYSMMARRSMDTKDIDNILEKLTLPTMAAHPLSAELLKSALQGDEMLPALNFYLSVVCIYDKCTDVSTRKEIAPRINELYVQLCCDLPDLARRKYVKATDVTQAPPRLWDEAIKALLPALDSRVKILIRRNVKKAKLLACIHSTQPMVTHLHLFPIRLSLPFVLSTRVCQP